MGDLAKAYVQIVPSARGMKEGLTSIVNGEMPSGGKSAGGIFGSNLVGKIKSVITVAAIGKALSSSITAGAELEQSLGGIETLLKDSAATVIANAEQAYKTAGMSANSYMEQVTGFAASLLQSLGGDTGKAAEISNMALTDMSDNANKFGTDMQRITDAYQGFAKQNYTMLDNLKLGYGGTKKEMQRLLKDATALTGVKYDIKNLSDVYTAIHVIQNELGVTGTTALEAAETLSGSFSSVKAAFTNVLGNLALGRDIKPSLIALAQTTVTLLKGNLVPAVKNIITALPGAVGVLLKALIPSSTQEIVNTIVSSLSALDALAQSVVSSLKENLVPAVKNIITSLPKTVGTLLKAVIPPNMQEIVNSAISNFSTFMTTSFPTILENGTAMVTQLVAGFQAGFPEMITSAAGLIGQVLSIIVASLPGVLESGASIIMQLVTGFLSVAPSLYTAAEEIIQQLLTSLMQALPSMLSTGAQFIMSMVSGLLSNLPSIVSSATTVVANLLTTFASHLPDLLAQGISLIGQLVAGSISMIPDVISAAIDICKGITNTFGEIDWLTLGKNIIDGIITGIRNAAESLFNALRDLAKKALQAAKDALGIQSPSKLFRDQVGRYIPAGVAQGVRNNLGLVKSAVRQMSAAATDNFTASLRMDTQASGNTSAGGVSNGHGLTVNQYIYSKAQTAADLMLEARYQAEMAVMLGV